MGIEPTLSAWKAEVLPLNYTRLYVQQCLAKPAFCQSINVSSGKDDGNYRQIKIKKYL